MNTSAIDWTQLWYPGRKQPFTAQEMAQAGSDAPSPTLVAVATVNFATVAFVVLQLAPAGQTARLTAALLAMAVMGSTTARWLWWRPWRRPLMLAMLAVAAAMLLFTLGASQRIPNRDERHGVALVLCMGSALLVSVLWVVTVWRAQQIEGRLREQAEREKAIDMARRLAAAQIEPHFLFNTLASLQHWVQTRDDRAAPLLASLTGYLRATLPLFRQPLLPAGDELLAVQRYLEVMQTRLGPHRLAFSVEADETARRALLPPGLLLTLTENAVGHGVEPLLSGGRVQVRVAVQGVETVIEVLDNGPGLTPGATEGIGLGNVRERLALAAGPAAHLTLGVAPGGGCRAEIRLPTSASPSPTTTAV